jgi:hypothetical protein
VPSAKPDHVSAAVRRDDPTSTWEDIDPQIAVKYLEKDVAANEQNRPLTQSRINDLADIMVRGRFEQTHQGIAFSDTGALVDGQHRLWAVVESGVTVRMLVTRGLSPAAVLAIDMGRARSVAETARRSLKIERARDVCAWAGIHRSLASSTTGALGLVRLEDYYADNLVSVLWATRSLMLKGLLRVAPVLGAMVFAHGGSPAVVERFAVQYASGDGAMNDPPRYLRELVLNGSLKSAVSHDRRTVALRTLRAIQAYAAGDSIKVLIAGEGALDYFKTLREKAGR